jgi:hypothetical protein
MLPKEKPEHVHCSDKEWNQLQETHRIFQKMPTQSLSRLLMRQIYDIMPSALVKIKNNQVEITNV